MARPRSDRAFDVGTLWLIVACSSMFGAALYATSGDWGVVAAKVTIALLCGGLYWRARRAAASRGE